MARRAGAPDRFEGWASISLRGGLCTVVMLLCVSLNPPLLCCAVSGAMALLVRPEGRASFQHTLTVVYMFVLGFNTEVNAPCIVYYLVIFV